MLEFFPNEKGIITGHFIAHWGVPKEIRPRKIQGIGDFAILEFSPKKKENPWRYATNGMSSYVQYHPNKNIKVRTELYACTMEKMVWVDDLLTAIATYPKDYNTYLTEYDTINVGQPIDQNQSLYNGLLLASPEPNDPATLGFVGGLQDNILVHQIVALFPSELEFAKKKGGKLLWEKLLRIGEPLYLDANRTRAV